MKNDKFPNSSDVECKDWRVVKKYYVGTDSIVVYDIDV